MKAQCARAEACAAILALALGLGGASTDAAADKRAFVVADSIAMTRLVDPNPSYERLRVSNFNISPDGERFAIITRTGSLSTGANTYSLLLYGVDDVRDFVQSRAHRLPPSPALLASAATTQPEAAIQQLSWLKSSRDLAFIGLDAKGARQVFAVSTETGHVRQLTHHPHDVAAYAISDDLQTIVYSARVIPDWSHRNTHGYIVESEYISYLSMTDPAEAIPEWQYFAAYVADSNRFHRIQLAPSIVPGKAWLSPTSEWCIALEYMAGLPERWVEYNLLGDVAGVSLAAARSPAADSNGDELITDLDDDAFGAPSGWLARFVLANTETGETRALLDTPSNGMGNQVARWSADGARAVIGPVFLPLSTSDSNERERRRRLPAIAEVEIASGRVTRIVDFPESGLTNASVFLGNLELGKDGVVVVTELTYRNGELTQRAYRKDGDRWAADPAYVGSAKPVRLSIAQDMNTPPELAAVDPVSGRSRVFTDFNPQLRNLAMGRVETFSWSDRLGRRFVGGLVKPPGFERGRRYPVVIQTYGFREDSFLVDGPDWMTTAYAARALAAQQLLVLQMPEGSIQTEQASTSANAVRHWEEYGENPRFVAMLEAAIDALDARKLIDRDRVGLIGFSRSGMHVHYAITFSKYPIAAATVADSIVATPFSYALMYGAYLPGMLEYESSSLIGAPFWGEGVKLWIERSPAFHLEEIRTPLRFERFGTFPPPFWDTFAILKRHGRPVEMVHIPLGTHVLETPFARYTSQQGNVDWFRFWLLGEEDSEPAKAQQYERWRQLRRQHLRTLRRTESRAHIGLGAPES